MNNFWQLLISLLFGENWRIPRFISRPARLLWDTGLTMSTLFVGRQGAGKTMALAMELYELIKAHPEWSFLFFDWSGGLILALFLLALSDPDGGSVIRRFVYDAMGGRTVNGRSYIMPLPEYHESYDPEKSKVERAEDQVDRTQRTFEALYHEEMVRNPTMFGRPIKALLKNLLLLANSIIDRGGSWQLTEATKLLNKEIRDNAVRLFGGRIGAVHEYFNKTFTGEEKFDKELAQSLADILDIFKPRRIRARLGYHTPGWTPREVIQNGLVLLCDGSTLAGNLKLKDFEFLRLFHLIKNEIDKRIASAPFYQPINWVMDEIYTFTEMPNGSRFISHLVTEYRNRGVQLFLVCQSLKQLSKQSDGRSGLGDFVFSFGNIVVFPLLDIDDCILISKNFKQFDPQAVKVPARTDTQHDIMENVNEQVMRYAYQIQHLAHREAFVRRFITEERMDRIIHVGRTREFRITATFEDVERLKDRLIMERGVPLDEANAFINNRKISAQRRSGSTATGDTSPGPESV